MTEFKTWEQMTEEEKNTAQAEMPACTKVEDFATFRIDRNKSGRITLIKGQELTAEKSAELNRPNIIEAYTVAYKLGNRKDQKKAASKFTAEAVRVLERHGK